MKSSGPVRLSKCFNDKFDEIRKNRKTEKTRCGRRREKKRRANGPVRPAVRFRREYETAFDGRSVRTLWSAYRSGLSTRAARQTNVLGVIRRRSWTGAFSAGNRGKPTRSVYVQEPPSPRPEHQYARDGRLLQKEDLRRGYIRRPVAVCFAVRGPSPETRPRKYPPPAAVRLCAVTRTVRIDVHTRGAVSFSVRRVRPFSRRIFDRSDIRSPTADQFTKSHRKSPCRFPSDNPTFSRVTVAHRNDKCAHIRRCRRFQ